MENKSKLIGILRIITFFVFIGRAYQHIFRDAPYRAFLWNEGWLKGIVENGFGVPWNEYVTDLSIANKIYIGIKVIGVFYLCCAFAALLLKSTSKLMGKLFLIGGSIGLVILAFLYCKEKFFHVGQFFEYAIQFTSPLLLYLMLYTNTSLKKIRWIGLVAIALTFVCHGLYAIGYYPRPGTFVVMTLNIIPINEPAAHVFLRIMGVLDFIVAIGIFIPRISYISLLYCFVWGILTAVARVAGHFYVDFLWDTFNLWIWEMLIRLPHGLIPLFIIIMDRPKEKWYRLKPLTIRRVNFSK